MSLKNVVAQFLEKRKQKDFEQLERTLREIVRKYKQKLVFLKELREGKIPDDYFRMKCKVLSCSEFELNVLEEIFSHDEIISTEIKSLKTNLKLQIQLTSNENISIDVIAAKIKEEGNILSIEQKDIKELESQLSKSTLIKSNIGEFGVLVNVTKIFRGIEPIGIYRLEVIKQQLEEFEEKSGRGNRLTADIEREIRPEYPFLSGNYGIHDIGLTDYASWAEDLLQDLEKKYILAEETINNFKNQIVVDLGAGAFEIGYFLAVMGGAKAYIGVEPYYYGELFVFLSDVEYLCNTTYFNMKLKKEDLIPASIVNLDMLKFIKLLPDNSVSFLACGIGKPKVIDERYADNVKKVIPQKLNQNGVFICYQSNDLSPCPNSYSGENRICLRGFKEKPVKNNSRHSIFVVTNEVNPH